MFRGKLINLWAFLTHPTSNNKVFMEWNFFHGVLLSISLNFKPFQNIIK